jgi:hypothetical protein
MLLEKLAAHPLALACTTFLLTALVILPRDVLIL